MNTDKRVVYGDLRDLIGAVDEDEPVDTTHEYRVRELMLHADLLHVAKEKKYNRSFARRGMIGIFMNVARKFDNIETIVKKEEYYDFHLIDALFDIAIYAFKMIDVIRRIYPQSYSTWYEQVYSHFVETEDIDA